LALDISTTVLTIVNVQHWPFPLASDVEEAQRRDHGRRPRMVIVVHPIVVRAYGSDPFLGVG
jgi:hypothetical protein